MHIYESVLPLGYESEFELAPAYPAHTCPYPVTPKQAPHVFAAAAGDSDMDTVNCCIEDVVEVVDEVEEVDVEVVVSEVVVTVPMDVVVEVVEVDVVESDVLVVDNDVDVVVTL